MEGFGRLTVSVCVCMCVMNEYQCITVELQETGVLFKKENSFGAIKHSVCTMSVNVKDLHIQRHGPCVHPT